MKYHGEMHRELDRERRMQEVKDRREHFREMERDREEFLSSGQPVAMPSSQLRFLNTRGNRR